MALRQELPSLMNKPEKQKIRQYIQNNLSDIKEALKSKIENSDYWLDTFMEPPDQIVIDKGTDKGKLHPLFHLGQQFLNQGKYKQAIQNFNELLQKLEHRKVQDRARDWLAYSYALNTESNKAKNILEPVCEGDHNIPSAYWNLAHIESDTNKKLDALDKGMQNAPTMALLIKAVHLGIDQPNLHTKLCDWLSQIPFLESVLLHYYFFDLKALDFNQLHKRINAYIVYKDLEIPVPISKGASEIIIQNINTIVKSTNKHNHLEVRNFWLRCIHPYKGQWRNEYKLCSLYYETCTDTYKDLNRLREAVEAFKEEIEYHISYMESIIHLYPDSVKDEGKPLNKLEHASAGQVRDRLQKHLPTYVYDCDNRVKNVGIEIFQNVYKWCLTNKIFIHLEKEFDSYKYGVSIAPVISLTEMLISIGTDLNKNFRSLHDFNHHSTRNQLEKLVTALKDNDKKDSAEKLEQLITALQNLSEANKEAEVSETLNDCFNTQRQFFRKLDKDLSDNEYVAAEKIRVELPRFSG